MFGFRFEEMETTGSAERFPARLNKFRKAGKRFPMLQHYFWWVMHNCVTHFLIGLIPIKPFFQFHDWTSIKLNVGEAALSTPFEDLEACKMQAEKILAKLNEINNSEETPLSIFRAEELVDNLEKDIKYHEGNKTESRLHRLRKTFRIIFKEK